MPLKINVPFAQKDLAKQYGALWNNELKTWFVPDDKDLNNFLAWIEHSLILKTFGVSIGDHICFKCKKSIKVIAVYSTNFYLQQSNKRFIKNNSGNLFNYLTYIDDAILAQIYGFSSSEQFKLVYSKAFGGNYWANTCIHCGSIAGDHYLHNEPTGCFHPNTVQNNCISITGNEFDFCLDGNLARAISFKS